MPISRPLQQSVEDAAGLLVRLSLLQSTSTNSTFINSFFQLVCQIQGIFHITLHELKSAGLPPSSPYPSSSTVEELPKKKRSWDLRTVRGLDGKYDSSIAKGVPCLQFSLTFASGSGDQDPKTGAPPQE